MHKPPTSRLVLLIAYLTLVGMSSGCSVFGRTRKLDMEPFAENTVTAIGEMRKIEAPLIWIRNRRYYDHPAIVRARATTKPLFDLVRHVNAYSLQIVSLNESRISDRAKVRELAKYLREASQIAIISEEDSAEVHLTPERLNQVLDDVGKRENLMDALLAAEPIVNAVVTRGFQISDAVDASLNTAVGEIEALVQAQYADMLQNRGDLVKLQEQTTRAFTRAERLAFGDEAAADELRTLMPVLAEYLPAGRKPGAKEQQAVVTVLTAQAAHIKQTLDQIEPESQAYRESILELDMVRQRRIENAKLARTVLIVWGRSHKSLARGVEVPPMFDLGGIIAASAGAAAKVSPVPIPF